MVVGIALVGLISDVVMYVMLNSGEDGWQELVRVKARGASFWGWLATWQFVRRGEVKEHKVEVGK